MNNKIYYSLFISYGLSFTAIGFSYIIYSRILTPSEFGLYSIALTIGSIGIFLLDGGIKTAIIKLDKHFGDTEQSSILSWLLLVSVLLTGCLFAIKYPLGYFLPSVRSDYIFLALFASIYLLTYPFIVIPTALLERKLQYPRLGWIEAVSITIERGGPVIFLLWTNCGLYSFVIALLLGRLCRVFAVLLSHPIKFCLPDFHRLKQILPLMKEGGWIQLAAGVSLVRDNLHIIILGPIWGKEWVGYYSWGMQLCFVLSQAFVQVSARVSLPRMAQQKTFAERWQTCLEQVRFLTMFTAPLLFAGLLVVPGINESFFRGKWSPTLPLLPFLFFRMIIGMAITPIATLIPVQLGGVVFARFNTVWTVMEVFMAIVLIAILGPKGLAYSCAVSVLFGLYVGIRLLHEKMAFRTYKIVMKLIWKRPSLLVSISLSSIVIFLIKLSIPGNLLQSLSNNLLLCGPVSLVIIIISYLTERLVINGKIS